MKTRSTVGAAFAFTLTVLSFNLHAQTQPCPAGMSLAMIGIAAIPRCIGVQTFPFNSSQPTGINAAPPAGMAPLSARPSDGPAINSLEPDGSTRNRSTPATPRANSFANQDFSAPLNSTHKAALERLARENAQAGGMPLEQALWNYAKLHNLSDAQVDNAMGWSPGAMNRWVQGESAPRVLAASPSTESPAVSTAGLQGNSNPTQPPSSPIAVAGPGVASSFFLVPPGGGFDLPQTKWDAPRNNENLRPFSPYERQEVLNIAERLGKAAGVSPEYALYLYKGNKNITNDELDIYMGWPTGTTLRWAVDNGFARPSN